MTMQL